MKTIESSSVTESKKVKMVIIAHSKMSSTEDRLDALTLHHHDSYANELSQLTPLCKH